MEGTNWQNELIADILNVQHKLEDAKSYSNKNQDVQRVYQEAINAVQDAREAINRFAAVYNNT